MALPGNEDHRIPLEKAKELVQNHRRHAGEHAERSGVFGRRILEEILAQPNCAGIRVYHARHEDGRQAIVLVGVDGEENDLLALGWVADNHRPCPPYCGSQNSPLNL